MSEKRYLSKNVYEAAQERISCLFSEFDHVLVSFSGGKDSSVCLNLAYDYAREHGYLDRMALYYMDYEAQYQTTTDYVTQVYLDDTPEILEKLWYCVPIGADCCCRSDSKTWIPWDPDAKDIWVRPMPDNPYVIDWAHMPIRMKKGEYGRKVKRRLMHWYADSHDGKTAVVMGIRADESLVRLSAITSDRRTSVYDGRRWIVSQTDKLHYAYPIYDWAAEDDFIYFARHGKSYCGLYDQLYQMGLKPDQMRTASPFHRCGADTLRKYKKIDPATWDRMLRRVAGANSTAVLGRIHAVLPEGHTWESYCHYLIDTLPASIGEHYKERLAHYLDHWQRQGVHPTQEGFWRQMCNCICDKDYTCAGMSLAKERQLAQRRAKMISKYKNL